MSKAATSGGRDSEIEVSSTCHRAFALPPFRMISAFTNIFKIPELRQRVLFTLAMIVIVRVGSAITTPGVNADDPARMVPQCRRCSVRRRRRRAVQSLQRRRAGALRDFLAGHHALHQRVDHAAAAHRGGPAARQARARGRRPAEDHAVHPLRHDRPVHVPGLPARPLLREPAGESVPAGIMDTINRLGMDLVPEPGLGVSA